MFRISPIRKWLITNHYETSTVTLRMSNATCLSYALKLLNFYFLKPAYAFLNTACVKVCMHNHRLLYIILPIREKDKL